jgi:ribA/ribD-fused uncharacterized protein
MSMAECERCLYPIGFGCVCDKKPAQGTPEPPKAEEILITDERLEQIKQIRAYGLQAEPTALLLAIDDLLHALRPYFPPASQTPHVPESLLLLWDDLVRLEEIVESHDHHEFDSCDVCGERGQYRIAKSRYEAEAVRYVDHVMRVATPASTARTDGWVSNHKLDTETRVHFYEQEFYVLSNFSSFRLFWRGMDFDTSEAAYHYEKFPNHPAIQEAIKNARSAHEAFKIAERHKSERRPDWDAVKIEIMRDVLRCKVNQHEYVRRKLLQTGTRLLVEDSWRDSFWGWGEDGEGQNVLGQLWMEIRRELPAAPGSVPQARTEIERLIAEQGVKPMVTGHELEIPGLTDEDMEGLPGWPAGVPQAEPPKEGVRANTPCPEHKVFNPACSKCWDKYYKSPQFGAAPTEKK